MSYGLPLKAVAVTKADIARIFLEEEVKAANVERLQERLRQMRLTLRKYDWRVNVRQADGNR